ncbi:hypothetical protein HDU96_001044 [Phlyctochytrium bullatum]|nr:hypothetical protein HDU96_001044 [Phlyctochytrium bullatum]
MSSPVPFKISVAEEAIEDLALRLAAARIPDELVENSRWSNGTSQFYGISIIDIGIEKKYLEKLLDHWKKVLHPLAESSSPDLPAFHVVAPCIPGFGFSEKVTVKGFGLKFVAGVYVKMMEALGYDRFFVQGGDWGAFIARTIAVHYPKNCQAIHLQLTVAPLPTSLTYLPRRLLFHLAPHLVLPRADLDALYYTRVFERRETGYARIQETKPFTLAVGLNDSPVGLLAWVGEKYRTFPSRDTPMSTGMTIDDVITNVAVYWFTGTIGTSFRLYKEERNIQHIFKVRINQPTGIVRFPTEIYKPPRQWLEYNHNLIHYSTMPQGGHFAALEEPDLLVEDIRAFTVKALRWLRKETAKL